eukprot:COSAG01_NODE_176_length_22957_cov_72.262096_5_plen_192_part_00
MGSYPRCAPRSGRCGGRQGVVCVRVCLAEASVGLIGGCVRSCRLGGARRHPPPRAHGGSCRWLGLLCRAKRLLTRRLGVCSQVAIRARRSGVLVRWRVGCVWCCRCVSVCVRLPAGRRGSQVDRTYPGGSITPAPPPRLPQRTGAAARPRGYLPVVLGVHRSGGGRSSADPRKSAFAGVWRASLACCGVTP